MIKFGYVNVRDMSPMTLHICSSLMDSGMTSSFSQRPDSPIVMNTDRIPNSQSVHLSMSQIIERPFKKPANLSLS